MFEYKYVYISSISNDKYEYFYSLMDIEKQKRVAEYINDVNKQRTIAGEILARQMISKYCSLPLEEIHFEIGLHGKPKAKNLKVEFNISHSNEMVVCAVGDKPVGIDVEMVRPIGTGVLRRVCTDADLEYIFGNCTKNDNPPLNFNKQQLQRFYEVWTAKEAYFKCLGAGIKNLKSVSMEDLIKNRKMYQTGNYVITATER